MPLSLQVAVVVSEDASAKVQAAPGSVLRKGTASQLVETGSPSGSEAVPEISIADPSGPIPPETVPFGGPFRGASMKIVSPPTPPSLSVTVTVSVLGPPDV